MREDYAEKCRAFFGTAPPETGYSAIITNISPLYEAVKREGAISAETCGFYPATRLSFDREKEYLLVKTTPGSVIIDVTRLLAQSCEKILLFGIAGSLSDSLGIGEVVQPERFNKAGYPAIAIRGEAFSVMQTTGLIQSMSYYRGLAEARIALVDMESYDFMVECRAANVEGACVFQISDNPFSAPFYRAKRHDISIELFLRLGGVRSHGF